MATQAKGQVTLRGRFRAGTEVRLVKVRNEGVLRAEGGQEVARATVSNDGEVKFSSGVEVGARYFVVGRVDGALVEVRVRGNEAGQESAVLAQAPVGYDRVKLADGTWADETPERLDTPKGEVAPAPSQRQVPEGTVQRSDTPHGAATPVDVGEVTPYPSQQDERFSSGKVVQRSDTELGQATPIPELASDAQQDAPDGLLQRSDTEFGVITPKPGGDAVAVQQWKESSEAKALVGEPVQAAAHPEVAASAPKAKARKAAPRKAKRPAAKPAAAKKSAPKKK